MDFVWVGLYLAAGILVHVIFFFWALVKGKEQAADGFFMGIDLWLLPFWPLALPFLILDALKEESKKKGVTSQPAKDISHLIGQHGTVVVELRPSGEIEIDGQRYDSIIDHAIASRGEEVKVTGGDGLRLKVKKKSPQ